MQFLRPCPPFTLFAITFPRKLGPSACLPPPDAKIWPSHKRRRSSLKRSVEVLFDRLAKEATEAGCYLDRLLFCNGWK
jgi:hypothetical protein